MYSYSDMSSVQVYKLCHVSISVLSGSSCNLLPSPSDCCLHCTLFVLCLLIHLMCVCVRVCVCACVCVCVCMGGRSENYELVIVRVSLNTGLDSPQECGTGTWNWIIELECGTGIAYNRLLNQYQHIKQLLIKVARTVN